MLIAEWAGCIEQNHTGALPFQGRSRRKSRESSEGIPGDHRRTTDALAHIGHQLIPPESAAVGQARWLGTAAEPEQIQGMHIMAAGQNGNVVTPVIR